MSSEWQFLVTLNEQLRPLRDPIEIQNVAIRLIGDHLAASRVSYVDINDDEFVIRRSYSSGNPPSAGRGAVARLGNAIVDACRRGETVVVTDVSADPRFTDEERQRFLAGRAVAFIGVPLIKDGRWLATFGVDSAMPRTWTRDQIALVEVTADRTWSAAERARAEEALGRSESRQAFLRRLNDAIRPLADPARILAETCRLIGIHLHVNRVAYGEIEGNDCVIVGEYVDGLPPQAGRFPWTSLGGSRDKAILKGGTLSVNDTSAEPHTAEERAALQAAGIGAYICPLLIKDGRFVGAFGIHSRSRRVWTPDEIALVEEVADRIWATLEHRKAEAELLANQDRLAFVLRLNDTLRPLSEPIAVQEAAARLLGEHLGVTRVGYAELEGHQYVIRCEYTRGVASLVGPVSGSFGAALGEAYQRGETVVVNDVQADSRFTESERIHMAGRQIAAFIGVTLIKRGRIVAAFGANNVTPRSWTPTEIALVRDVAERTWEAVERARAEAALREREYRFGLALSASGGGSWTWDFRTGHSVWDDAFRARFGFTTEEPPLFETWLARVHVDDRPLIHRALEEILQKSKDTWDHTYRVVRPDGSLMWMQSLGRADRDGAGQVTRLTGLELDITERRSTEETLQALRDEARDRELRTLLEIATQGIVSVDARNTIVSANHAFAVMFGWAPDELIGQPVERLIPSVFREGYDHRSGLDMVVGTRKDSSTFPIEVSVSRVPGPGGGRAFAFVTDITERQRAASALQERTAELEYRTTQLSRMAWDLTLAEHHAREQIARTLHDGLQQLLVIVALNLEQLQREGGDGAARRELLDEAKRHLDEAAAAARSLNIELFPPVLQRSGLPTALKWLANWMRDKYRLDVHVDADPRADAARKDVRTLLFESVRELLFNAFKHARAAQVTVGLTLDDDDQLCITVADDGSGFEPARLDDRSKTGAAGWGLFSIRERLTLLGGHLDIDSAPGRGTRVRLVAPRGAAQKTKAVARADEPMGVQSEDGRHRTSADALKILIVDDHGAVRNALRGILRQWPELFVVGEASNGWEAIAQAHTAQPDVILMDVAMPHMDGVQATERLRAELPDILILGLSMHSRSETVHALERAGAKDFFVKGVDTQRLIDHLLAVHASRGDVERASP